MPFPTTYWYCCKGSEPRKTQTQSERERERHTHIHTHTQSYCPRKQFRKSIRKRFKKRTRITHGSVCCDIERRCLATLKQSVRSWSSSRGLRTSSPQDHEIPFVIRNFASNPTHFVSAADDLNPAGCTREIISFVFLFCVLAWRQ